MTMWIKCEIGCDVNKSNYEICWVKITFSEQPTNLFYSFNVFFIFNLLSIDDVWVLIIA